MIGFGVWIINLKNHKFETKPIIISLVQFHFKDVFACLLGGKKKGEIFLWISSMYKFYAWSSSIKIFFFIFIPQPNIP